MITYISTRGQSPELNFADVLLTGLASDGGLYVPKTLPHFSADDIASFKDLSYSELAFKIMYPFVEGSVDADSFKQMLNEVYAHFAHPSVAPLVQLSEQDYVLELFHGPTLAFKDFALQLLGRLLDYELKKRNERVVIMGATSGDTGSAAIEGCKHCDNVDIFILHPYQRVSEVQRRQMTTVKGDNIYNLAIEGNFDDAQNMVKQSFAKQDFLQNKRKLVAVNSINWARIMAQVVYYFYASVHLGAPKQAVAYSVPTGNFGDIYAGYIAKQMGLPISKLIIATNSNDVLHRIMQDNLYQLEPLKHTITPSMDISISSNFERLLFDLYERDGNAIQSLMQEMQQLQQIALDKHKLDKARTLFMSQAVSEAQTIECIQNVFKHSNYLLDPHTAVGVKAGRDCHQDPSIPLVTLATAHPVKFAQAIEMAGLPTPNLPSHLSDLMQREEYINVLPNELSLVQDFMVQKIFN